MSSFTSLYAFTVVPSLRPVTVMLPEFCRVAADGVLPLPFGSPVPSSFSTPGVPAGAFAGAFLTGAFTGFAFTTASAEASSVRYFSPSSGLIGTDSAADAICMVPTSSIQLKKTANGFFIFFFSPLIVFFKLNILFFCFFASSAIQTNNRRRCRKK